MLPQYFCCMFTILCLRSIWLKIFFFLTCSTMSVVHLERKASVFHPNLFYCPMAMCITKFSLLKAKVKMQPSTEIFIVNIIYILKPKAKAWHYCSVPTCLVGKLHNCLLIAICKFCKCAVVHLSKNIFEMNLAEESVIWKIYMATGVWLYKKTLVGNRN